MGKIYSIALNASATIDDLKSICQKYGISTIVDVDFMSLRNKSFLKSKMKEAFGKSYIQDRRLSYRISSTAPDEKEDPEGFKQRQRLMARLCTNGYVDAQKYEKDYNYLKARDFVGNYAKSHPEDGILLFSREGIGSERQVRIQVAQGFERAGYPVNNIVMGRDGSIHLEPTFQLVQNALPGYDVTEENYLNYYLLSKRLTGSSFDGSENFSCAAGFEPDQSYIGNFNEVPIYTGSWNYGKQVHEVEDGTQPQGNTLRQIFSPAIDFCVRGSDVSIVIDTSRHSPEYKMVRESLDAKNKAADRNTLRFGLGYISIPRDREALEAVDIDAKTSRIVNLLRKVVNQRIANGMDPQISIYVTGAHEARIEAERSSYKTENERVLTSSTLRGRKVQARVQEGAKDEINVTGLEEDDIKVFVNNLMDHILSQPVGYDGITVEEEQNRPLSDFVKTVISHGDSGVSSAALEYAQKSDTIDNVIVHYPNSGAYHIASGDGENPDGIVVTGKSAVAMSLNRFHLGRKNIKINELPIIAAQTNQKIEEERQVKGYGLSAEMIYALSMAKTENAELSNLQICSFIKEVDRLEIPVNNVDDLIATLARVSSELTDQRGTPILPAFIPKAFTKEVLEPVLETAHEIITKREEAGWYAIPYNSELYSANAKRFPSVVNGQKAIDELSPAELKTRNKQIDSINGASYIPLLWCSGDPSALTSDGISIFAPEESKTAKMASAIQIAREAATLRVPVYTTLDTIPAPKRRLYFNEDRYFVNRCAELLPLIDKLDYEREYHRSMRTLTDCFQAIEDKHPGEFNDLVEFIKEVSEDLEQMRQALLQNKIDDELDQLNYKINQSLSKQGEQLLTVLRTKHGVEIPEVDTSLSFDATLKEIKEHRKNLITTLQAMLDLNQGAKSNQVAVVRSDMETFEDIFNRNIFPACERLEQDPDWTFSTIDDIRALSSTALTHIDGEDTLYENNPLVEAVTNNYGQLVAFTETAPDDDERQALLIRQNGGVVVCINDIDADPYKVRPELKPEVYGRQEFEDDDKPETATKEVKPDKTKNLLSTLATVTYIADQGMDSIEPFSWVCSLAYMTVALMNAHQLREAKRLEDLKTQEKKVEDKGLDFTVISKPGKPDIVIVPTEKGKGTIRHDLKDYYGNEPFIAVFGADANEYIKARTFDKDVDIKGVINQNSGTAYEDDVQSLKEEPTVSRLHYQNHYCKPAERKAPRHETRLFEHIKSEFEAEQRNFYDALGIPDATQQFFPNSLYPVVKDNSVELRLGEDVVFKLEQREDGFLYVTNTPPLSYDFGDYRQAWKNVLPYEGRLHIIKSDSVNDVIADNQPFIEELLNSVHSRLFDCCISAASFIDPEGFRTEEELKNDYNDMYSRPDKDGNRPDLTRINLDIASDDLSRSQHLYQTRKINPKNPEMSVNHAFRAQNREILREAYVLEHISNAEKAAKERDALVLERTNLNDSIIADATEMLNTAPKATDENSETIFVLVRSLCERFTSVPRDVTLIDRDYQSFESLRKEAGVDKERLAGLSSQIGKVIDKVHNYSALTQEILAYDRLSMREYEIADNILSVNFNDDFRIKEQKNQEEPTTLVYGKTEIAFGPSKMMSEAQVFAYTQAQYEYYVKNPDAENREEMLNYYNNLRLAILDGKCEEARITEDTGVVIRMEGKYVEILAPERQEELLKELMTEPEKIKQSREQIDLYRRQNKITVEAPSRPFLSSDEAESLARSYQAFKQGRSPYHKRALQEQRRKEMYENRFDMSKSKVIASFQEFGFAVQNENCIYLTDKKMRPLAGPFEDVAEVVEDGHICVMKDGLYNYYDFETQSMVNGSWIRDFHAETRLNDWMEVTLADGGHQLINCYTHQYLNDETYLHIEPTEDKYYIAQREDGSYTLIAKSGMDIFSSRHEFIRITKNEKDDYYRCELHNGMAIYFKDNAHILSEEDYLHQHISSNLTMRK